MVTTWRARKVKRKYEIGSHNIRKIEAKILTKGPANP